MLVAGIDIGSRGSKAVIMEDEKIVSYSTCATGPDSVRTAEMTMNEALKGTGLFLRDLEYIVATGYGRVLVPFAVKNITEIACHAKGAHWYFPSTRTILDMGGQDCKAISCDEKGRVTRFVMNDKCAGGTGRFLEVIAKVLQIPLEEIGEVSLQSRQAIDFSTVCAVFARSETYSLVKKGVAKSDIFAGLHRAIAARCRSLLGRISVEKDFTITGGVARNNGMVKAIRDGVGLEPLIAEEPLIVGAVGACLFARERLGKEKG